MKSNITPELVRSYFHGTCGATEKKEVEIWLRSADENYAQAMRWIKEKESEEDEKFLAHLLVSEDEIWRRTKNTIEENEGSQILNSRKNKRPARISWYAAAAAVSAITLGLWLTREQTGKNRVVIETAFNETRRVTLPDSSLVILNSNSALSYVPSQFATERQVQMKGEAFFDIQHTSDNRTFRVCLPEDKVVEVLGTEFNVSERKDVSEITLKSGKIRLDMPRDEKPIDLLPGQMVKIDKEEGSVVRSDVNAELHYSWIKGKWKFDHATLKEIITRIEETRGVKVYVYKPSLNKRTISGTIPLHGNALTLVTNVANAFDLAVENRDGTFYLTERE